jgi:hypothetical protein
LEDLTPRLTGEGRSWGSPVFRCHVESSHIRHPNGMLSRSHCWHSSCFHEIQKSEVESFVVWKCSTKRGGETTKSPIQNSRGLCGLKSNLYYSISANYVRYCHLLYGTGRNEGRIHASDDTLYPNTDCSMGSTLPDFWWSTVLRTHPHAHHTSKLPSLTNKQASIDIRLDWKAEKRRLQAPN